jgi:type IX secretion system PorP/SprF family membrane protein
MATSSLTSRAAQPVSFGSSRWAGVVLLALLLGSLAPPAKAQQDPQFTQFRFMPFLYNPAAAGSEQGMEIFAAGRMQWAGLSGAPQSQSLSGHLPLYGLSSGVGFSVWNDQAGLGGSTGFYAAYAYQLELGRKSRLAIGVSAGGIQYRLNGEDIRTPEGVYEGFIDHNDPYLPITRTQGIAADFGVGIWFQSERFRAGASSTHLLEPDVTLALGNGNSSIRMLRHYYVTAAYEIELGGNLSLEPGVGVRQSAASTVLDANLILFVQRNMWVGTAFRSNLANGSDAVGGMAGTQVGQRFRLGYAYDYSLHSLNQVSGGSHELFLAYRFAIEKPKAGKRINNPRFLHY